VFITTLDVVDELAGDIVKCCDGYGFCQEAELTPVDVKQL